MNLLQQQMKIYSQRLREILSLKEKSLNDGTIFKERDEYDSLSRFMYSYDVFVECSMSNYQFIQKFMKKHQFESIVDIGAAHGIQSELFREVDYIGVDVRHPKEKRIQWREEEVEYVYEKYPCLLPSFDKNKTLGVSVLCLTWNCYLEDANTLKNQLTSLKQDFDHVLLYTSLKQEDLSPYFKVKHLNGNFYYLTKSEGK